MKIFNFFLRGNRTVSSNPLQAPSQALPLAPARSTLVGSPLLCSDPSSVRGRDNIAPPLTRGGWEGFGFRGLSGINKLTPSLVYSLVISILLVIAPHAEHLPWPITIPCAIFLSWRFYLTYSGKELPPRWLLFGITLAGAAGIFLTYHTLFGREAGVALLVLLSTLKLLELRSTRDVTLLILLSFFIIITNFFYSQSIPTALYMLATLLLILSTWIHMHTGTLSFKPRLRIAGLLLLQAVPLMLVLFVLFPRVQGPLWGLPQDAYSSSGLSDSMSPGTLSKLSLSQAVAFRVSFDGTPPPHAQMYWRGPVLWNFDGVTWTSGTKMRSKLPQLDILDSPVDYTVTLEPHNKRWLFALDLPTKLSIPYAMTDDFQLESKEPVNARIRYRAHSQLGYRANVEEAPSQLQRALELPHTLNPRARKLATEWRASMPNDEAIVRTAYSYFNREQFVYTLEPPLLGANGIDEFLFESRKGFCEHYASSFVFLMRAAAIPARVVTGYQGGEANDYGGYTIVRQADAHAWAEVWLARRGWVRIDPTASISPERVQSGLSAAMPDSLMLPFFARTQSSWLLNLRFNLDMINHQWNQWVLGYDPERQFAFLTRLGMEDVSWQKMAINLLIGVALLVGLFSLLLLRHLYKPSSDPAQILYLRFCRKLARAGTGRAAHEGPQDFAKRAANIHPQLAPAIHSITAHYLSMRYENLSDAAGLRALRREIASFKL
jgi:transglutaminase-like putative cysteine protease